MSKVSARCRLGGLFIVVSLLGLLSGCGPRAKELLNVSYDPTRELWQDLNDEFLKEFEKQSGETWSIKMSHGGSGSQARSVIDGLPADVLTLALWSDTNAVAKAGLMNKDWEKRFE